MHALAAVLTQSHFPEWSPKKFLSSSLKTNHKGVIAVWLQTLKACPEHCECGCVVVIPVLLRHLYFRTQCILL